MINNSPFDDHIKKQLGNYRPEVPPHIWENIMAKKEKRRPGGFFYSLRGARLTSVVVALVIVAAGGLYIHHIYKNNSPLNETSQVKSETGSILAKNNQPEPGIRNAKDQTISSNNSTEGQTTEEKNAQENSTSTIVREKTNTDNSVARYSNRGEIKSSAIEKTSKTDALKSVYKTNNAKSPKSESVQGQQSSFNTDIIPEKQSFAKRKHTTRKSAARSNLIIEKPEPEADPTQDVVTSGVVNTTSNEVSLNKYYLTLDKRQAKKDFSFSIKNINLLTLNIPCPGTKMNESANKRYIEIYGGPDYAFRSFHDTANSTYLRKRKESTRVSSAFSLGLRYTKVFNNGLSLRVGVNYSQVNEKFKFEQGHMIQLVYVVDGNGDTTGSYATTGTRYKTTHNKYRTLDIPLVAGYEFGTGKLHTNINLGLVINAYSWQKGDVLDGTYQPVSITTGKSSSPYQFKTNVGLGMTGGVSFYYQLTNSLHFLAEPYFRYNFSPANKSEITLKQKYTTAGLRVGLRLDF